MVDINELLKNPEIQKMMNDPKALSEMMSKITSGGIDENKIDWIIESLRLLNDKLNTINAKLDKVIAHA